MADFKDNDNVPRPARVTGNGDLVILDSYWKWLAQGKVFEAGTGIQTAADLTQGEAAVTPDDVKATFALVAPAGETPLVLPLFFKVMFEAEDSAAAPDSQLIFTKSAGECAAVLALSGRDMTVEGCMYKANPVKKGPAASPLHGVASTFLLTVSALVDGDAIIYDYWVGAAATNVTAPVTGSSQQRTHDFMHDAIPHILTSGAAMILYISGDTGDALVHPYIQWAELEPDDLL